MLRSRGEKSEGKNDDQGSVNVFLLFIFSPNYKKIISLGIFSKIYTPVYIFLIKYQQKDDAFAVNVLGHIYLLWTE